MSRQSILLVGADPLYRHGIRLALETLPGFHRLQEYDLQTPPAGVAQGDLVVLCLRDCRRSRELLLEWLPTEVDGRTPVVLFSATLGAQHLRLLEEGRVDLCLPANIGLEDTRARIAALIAQRSGEVRAVDPQHFLPDLADLSRKERQVLYLLSDGLSNRAIAEALRIQQNTVKVHLARICRKLNVRNRTQAACTANDILYQQAVA